MYPLSGVQGQSPWLQSDLLFAAVFKEHGQCDDGGESQNGGDGGGDDICGHFLAHFQSCF